MRVTCLKFIEGDDNVFVSGSWDKKLYINDLRVNRAVGLMAGTFALTDSIDIKGDTILAGNYSTNRSIQLFSLKK